MRSIRTVVAVAACTVAAAGCGGGNTTSSGGTAAGAAGGCPTNPSGTSGNGAHVSIGSKGFAEEQLLATMTKLVLEKHGFTVDYSLQAKDTQIGQALTSGQIDMLWQYTGTEITDPGYLNISSGYPHDLNGAFAFVQQKDAARGICWVAPAPMNDTNGIAITSDNVAKFGSSLSDFGNYLASHPDTNICILSEFRTRPDGIPGLAKTYNQAYANAHLTDVGSTAEKQIHDGSCDAGEVFTTDSPIAAFNLHVLTDDKNLFPPDNVGLEVRADVLRKYPAIAALMAPVAAKITSDEITKLNKQVEIDNQKPDDVAAAWLVANGF